MRLQFKALNQLTDSSGGFNGCFEQLSGLIFTAYRTDASHTQLFTAKLRARATEDRYATQSIKFEISCPRVVGLVFFYDRE